MTIESERPLRADAERNRQRLLEAAAEVFASRGLEVSMDDIARAAGVGVGTAYRRFRSRDELIDALFEERMAEFAAMTEAAAADPDPWHGLVTMMETSLEMQASDRGLKHLFHQRDQNRARVAAVRDEILSVMQGMVDRAHASGDLRPDVTLMDLTIVSMMVGAVADVTADQQPGAWRRALGLSLDALRANSAQTTPLPGAELTREQLDKAMECWRPPAPRS
jgi:AcrR family transcriptional regulator